MLKTQIKLLVDLRIKIGILVFNMEMIIILGYLLLKKDKYLNFIFFFQIYQIILLENTNNVKFTIKCYL